MEGSIKSSSIEWERWVFFKYLNVIIKTSFRIKQRISYLLQCFWNSDSTTLNYSAQVILFIIARLSIAFQNYIQTSKVVRYFLNLVKRMKTLPS